MSGLAHLLFSLVALRHLAHSWDGWPGHPCPFNSDCTCRNLFLMVEPNSFSKVICQIDSGFPNFTGQAGEYEAANMILTGDIRRIAPMAFAAFKSINTLIIKQELASKADWDPVAFHGPKIEALEVSNLRGLLPPPISVKLLGGSGLKRLSISSSEEEIALECNSFSDFKNLTHLIMEQISISTVEDKAFSGLEENLNELAIVSALISEYPKNAISPLKSLRWLNLTNTQINQFHHGDFDGPQNLQYLDMSGTDLQSAVGTGAFDILPFTLESLYLANGNLNEVPVKIVRWNPRITSLDLRGNKISVLRNDHFQQATNLQFLSLGENPISTIEPGTFRGLSSLIHIDLQKINAGSLDLSLFDGLSRVLLTLDNNPTLETLTVGGYSMGIGSISASNTGIQTLGPEFEAILGYERIERFDFENNKIRCDENVHWMANSYYVCHTKMEWLDKVGSTYRLFTAGTICSNLPSTSLQSYLIGKSK